MSHKVVFVKSTEPVPQFGKFQGHDYLVPVQCPKCNLPGHNLPCYSFVPAKCDNCFKFGHLASDCFENRWLAIRRKNK